jgi:hypothetical protein
MSKYWGIIVASHPHVFALGSHDNFDKAAGFAKDYVDRKNREIQEDAVKNSIADNDRRSDYDLLWVLDENELRSLIGEVHRPIVMARPAREAVGVEAPIRRGGAADVHPVIPAPAEEEEESAVDTAGYGGV